MSQINAPIMKNHINNNHVEFGLRIMFMYTIFPYDEYTRPPGTIANSVMSSIRTNLFHTSIEFHQAM